MLKNTKQELIKKFDIFVANSTVFVKDFEQVAQNVINKSMESNKKDPIYNRLSNKNIFIIGGASSGKTSLIETLKDVLPHKKIDVGKLFRIVAYFIFNDNEKNAVKPDIIKLKEGNELEIDKIAKILPKKICSLKGFFKRIKITQENNMNAVYVNSVNVEKELYSTDIDALVSIIAKSLKTRKFVWKWICQYVKNNPGNILTGHSLKEIDTTKYQIVNLRVDEREAVVRLLNNGLAGYTSLDDALNCIRRRNSNDKIRETEKTIGKIYNSIIIDTTNLTLKEVKNKVLDKLIVIFKRQAEKKKKQKKYEINRQKFEWHTNPLIRTIRPLSKDIFIDKARKYQNKGICEFDLAVQTMIHLAGRKVEDVWHGYQNNYKNNSSMDSMLHYLRNIKHEKKKLYDSLKNKKIILNRDLVQTEVERQTVRLMKLFKNTKTEYNGETIELPVFYMGNLGINPFSKKNIKTALTSKGGKIKKDASDGSCQFIIKEKISGKKVVIKRVPREISKLYAKGFHYLHSFREDEIASFGAYLENDLFPFTWVSYSLVDRAYKKEMLQYLGVESHRMLEMTRAWSSVWSPKNTMSILFTFAHQELIKKWKEKVKVGEVDQPLAGVITSINGNLGFNGSAFKGIGFKVVGLKPAHLTYLVSEDGSLTYMPRRSILKQLGLVKISELNNHPKYTSNKFPLLPTNEMALLFNQKENKGLDKKPIYVISDSCYKDILK